MSSEASTPELLCPFCNSVLDEHLYDSAYGCDRGCEYVRFELECPTCKKVVFDTGDFGSAFDDWDDVSAEEYREKFLEEWAERARNQPRPPEMPWRDPRIVHLPPFKWLREIGHPNGLAPSEVQFILTGHPRPRKYQPKEQG